MRGPVGRHSPCAGEEVTPPRAGTPAHSVTGRAYRADLYAPTREDDCKQSKGKQMQEDTLVEKSCMYIVQWASTKNGSTGVDIEMHGPDGPCASMTLAWDTDALPLKEAWKGLREALNRSINDQGGYKAVEAQAYRKSHPHA